MHKFQANYIAHFPKSNHFHETTLSRDQAIITASSRSHLRGGYYRSRLWSLYIFNSSIVLYRDYHHIAIKYRCEKYRFTAFLLYILHDAQQLLHIYHISLCRMYTVGTVQTRGARHTGYSVCPSSCALTSTENLFVEKEMRQQSVVVRSSKGKWQTIPPDQR